MVKTKFYRFIPKCQQNLVLLHAPRHKEPFTERAEVWEYLLECKERGIIRHVGVSTHFVKVARQAASIPKVEVIHSIINLTGMGIVDGSRKEMEEAINLAKAQGKGFYAMKALAGGNLIPQAREAFAYIMGAEEIDSVVVGMVTPQEVAFNLKLFTSKLEPGAWQEVGFNNKRLVVLPACTGCGSCVETCSTGALSVVDGKVRVNTEKCILCGYCAPACPQFYIRIV